jgi:uncharacterized protein (DUF1810 family)
MSSSDRHDLERFVDAQREIYDQVPIELRLGRKRNHWMWYMFPQITGLGSSAHAQSVEDVLGYPDNLKFHSSMTLFAHAANHHEVFESALRKYFRSEYDRLTMERLELPWPT